MMDFQKDQLLEKKKFIRKRDYKQELKDLL